MPATVYVTTYYVQRQVPVFGMLVQYLLWKTRCRMVSTAGIAGLEAGAVDLGDGAARDALLRRVLAAGADLSSEAARQALAAELASRLQVDMADIVKRRCFTMMSAAELGALARDGIDVQLHTHRHRFTPDRLEEAEHEVVENRAVLQGMVAGPLEHFCYPSGVWGPEAFPLLARLGIGSSTTCEPGLVSASTPRQALGRFLDGENIHALEFEAEISGFLELLRRARSWRPGASRA
jgi:peptidoglycan/xylan/chitin deacetylase (PgdA/CDA1 family)